MSRGIPEAEREEHRWSHSSNCLEHMLCQRLVFGGLPRWGLWVSTGLGCYRLPGWAFRAFQGLASSCPGASSLPISLSTSVSIFIVPVDCLRLLFHTPEPFFVLSPLNLLFSSMANYCLSFKTKLRCLLLQTTFHNPPDVHAFFCSTH